MTHAEEDHLIRRYAAGEITWFWVREHGFPTYLDILAALGERGLRPPIAEMTGPNVAARQRGIALVQRRIQEVASP